MAPEMLKTFYAMAVFVLGASLLLLLVVKPDTAEHAITVMSAVIGATLLLLVTVVARFFNR